MKKLTLDFTELDQTVQELKKIANVHATENPVELSFQGDFQFTKAGQELRNLMEQTRILWFNSAGFESALLQNMKDALDALDESLSRGIRIKDE